ncbi:hypothetical protein FOCC_FOCC002366 [Frankliniella occidentalis]|nr:hypothetical protein FOCC_FOCC002366 [Frankliniella occidentalis]
MESHVGSCTMLCKLPCYTFDIENIMFCFCCKKRNLIPHPNTIEGTSREWCGSFVKLKGNKATRSSMERIRDIIPDCDRGYNRDFLMESCVEERRKERKEEKKAAVLALVAQFGLSAVLVLEDDIRFEPFFRKKLYSLMDELRDMRAQWDLEEPLVPGAKQLVRPGYSYWTLGYMLSLTGARKLLAARPLDNLVPVDEYLPILFDRHPEESWRDRFPRRDLVALSAAPLLLYPTHYTGDKGYVSDTENSEVIPEPLRGASRPPAADQHLRQHRQGHGQGRSELRKGRGSAADSTEYRCWTSALSQIDRSTHPMPNLEL